MKASSVLVCVALLAAACGGGSSNRNNGNNNGNSSNNNGNQSSGNNGSQNSDAGAEEIHEPPPPPPMAKLRVIHASPEPTAASVAVFLDDSTEAAFTELTFKAAKGYAELPATEHTIKLRPGTDASVAPLLEIRAPALEQDHWYTAIAHGIAGAEPALTITFEPEAPMPVDAGKFAARFFHALAGAPAVDICVPGATRRAAATPLFVNVAYGQWGAPQGESTSGRYLLGAAGDIKLQVSVHAEQACKGASLGTLTVPAGDAKSWTLLAVGRLTAGARGALTGSKEVLACLDAAEASCSAIPIAAAGRAR